MSSTRTQHDPIRHGRLAFLLFFAIASWAWADGKFFLSSTSTEGDPSIPFQRAIVAYRDGVETLIVESAIHAPGDDFGWVVPLPAEPTEIAQCKPGTLKTVYQTVSPRIKKHVGTHLEPSGFPIFLLSMLVCMVAATHRALGQSRKISLVRVAAILFVFLVVLSIMMPTLATRLGHDPGLTVLQHRQIGSYEVTVIAGDSVEPILEWALENGFHVPEEAKPVLENYVSAHWCFVVAKIRSTEKELLTPHPLKFTFPTPQAVYPMRLTGIGARDMQLDLYVIAEQRSVVSPLELISCDTYKPSDPSWLNQLSAEMMKKYRVTSGKQFRADGIGITIGHPEMSALMWEGCRLTHLRSKLQPEQMQADYEIDWGRPVSVRKKLYTRPAAKAHGIRNFFLSAAVILTLGAAVALMRRKRKGESGLWFVKVLGISLLVGIVGGLISYLRLPLTNAVPVNRQEALKAWRLSSLLPHAYARILSGLDTGEQTIEPEKFADWWRQQVSESYGAEDLPEGDLPGHFEISQDDQGVVLTLYDEHATPIHLTISTRPSDSRSSECGFTEDSKLKIQD